MNSSNNNTNTNMNTNPYNQQQPQNYGNQNNDGLGYAYDDPNKNYSYPVISNIQPIDPYNQPNYMQSTEILSENLKYIMIGVASCCFITFLILFFSR